MKALTKGFNGGLWAFRLVFAVVVAELAIVGGTVVGCFAEDICNEADTQAIKETMQGLATKSFALYAAEKGIKSNSKEDQMDIQKLATYGTAVAVVGTGSVVGGGALIDQQTGGPEKRKQAETTELRTIVREELKKVLWEAWPEKTGPVKTYPKPDSTKDYRKETPKR